MTHRRAVMTALLLAALFVAAGCPRCPDELIGREELFRQYNTNADRIPTLWAVADVEFKLDHRGLFRSYRLHDGRLYFHRRNADPLAPQGFMIRGKEMTEELFRLGIDGAAGTFYGWVDIPDRGFAWSGLLADVDRGDLTAAPPELRKLPNPTDLLSLLGVLPWPTDLDAPTQAVLKTPADKCVYQMLVFSRREAWDGWYLTREVWLDRHDDLPRPFKVLLYDRTGQVTMSAELRKYAPVETDGDPSARPVIPTDIRIRWPDAKGIRAIRLRLSQPRVETDVTPDIMDARFEMWIPEWIRDELSNGGSAGD